MLPRFERDAGIGPDFRAFEREILGEHFFGRRSGLRRVRSGAWCRERKHEESQEKDARKEFLKGSHTFESLLGGNPNW
jgi:hypothetical protein